MDGNARPPQGAEQDAIARETQCKVRRYANRWGWTMTGLPDHGACIEVLARIIHMVERHRMHLGRWRYSYSAIYAAFVGKARSRSYSRHGCWWMDTRGCGGATTESEVYRDLLAYEEKLNGLTETRWAETRQEALESLMPKKRRKPAECGTKAGDVGVVPDAKPCIKLDYCPYGALIEQFPLSKPHDEHGCERFGHLCPSFVVAERQCDGNGSQGEMTVTV